MKKIVYLSFIALLLSCCTNKGDNIINASFPNAGENVISWLDMFPEMEMIRLTGEQLPMLNPWSYLIVREGMYYVIDQRHTQKVHRFNQNGIFQNSIGSHGRGPNEHLYLTDVMVDNDGNVLIYSMGSGSLLTYSPDGVFLERTELSYSPERFATLSGFNYHYMGSGSGMDYRLYVTDANGQAVGAFLPSPIAPPIPNNQTFSLFGSILNLCHSEGNNIYQLKDGKMEVKYSFNFGAYNIPEEFYQCNDYRELSDFFAKGLAIKNAFYENKHCAVLEVVVEMVKEYKVFYGVLNKQKNVWEWLNWRGEDDFVFLRYFDDEYAYFTAEPELMRQVPELTDRFPELKAVTDSEGVVILRAKTATAKL